MHARVTEHKALTRARRAAQRHKGRQRPSNGRRTCGEARRRIEHMHAGGAHKGRQRPSNGRRTGDESHVIKESRAPARRIGRGADDERRQRRARTPTYEPIVPNKGGTQKPSEVIRGHQRSSEVIRGHQRSSEAIRGHQRSSEVIRGNQRPLSEAITVGRSGERGNQRSSEVIRGYYQRQSPSAGVEGCE